MTEKYYGINKKNDDWANLKDQVQNAAFEAPISVVLSDLQLVEIYPLYCLIAERYGIGTVIPNASVAEFSTGDGNSKTILAFCDPDMLDAVIRVKEYKDFAAKMLPTEQLVVAQTKFAETKSVPAIAVWFDKKTLEAILEEQKIKEFFTQRESEYSGPKENGKTKVKKHKGFLVPILIMVLILLLIIVAILFCKILLPFIVPALLGVALIGKTRSKTSGGE